MQHSQITVLLNDEELNRKNSETFMLYAGSECSLPGFFVPKPYKLVRAVYCNEYRILSDDPQPKTLFFIRLFDAPHDLNYSIKKYPSLRKKMTQCLVWTSLVPNQRDAFQFLATKFFDHFLDSFNIAISVGPMTLCSAHFWEGRLFESFTKKDVSVFKASEHQVQKIPDWMHFQSEWSDIIFKSAENMPDDSMVIVSKTINESEVTAH